MTKFMVSLLVSAVAATASAQPMSGVYPVGPGGPGVDSFATVQDAASALSARGLAGDVDFPIAAGTYTGPVVVRAVSGSASFRTTFRSPLQPATIDAGGARYAFAVESTDNVTLHRLFFAGARDSGSAGLRFADSDHGHVRSGRVGDSAEVGILARRCDSLRLDSTRIEGDLAGPGSRGVELRDCRVVDVYRCSMPGTVGTGMLVAGGSDVSVYRMTVMNPLVAGLRLDGTARGTFWRCFTRGAPEYGIHALRSPSAYFDSCTVTGATVAGADFDECDSLVYRIPMIVGNAERAFRLRNSRACTVRVLSIMGQPTVGMSFERTPGCVVESTQVMGMSADTGRVLVVDSSPGISFTFLQAVGSFRQGIVVRRSDGARFRHARLRGTMSEAGIVLDNSSGASITTCSLSVASGIAGAAGVLVTGDCADDTLLGMTILADADNGVRAEGGGVRGLVVASSYLEGWTGAGVFCDGAASPRLFYNTVVGPAEAGVSGVRLRDVSGAEARDNIVWNRGLDSSSCYRVEGVFPFAAGASDHNDLYVSGAGGVLGRVNDTLYTGLDDWRAHPAVPDAHSLARDPLLAAPGDFHLTAESPCRDSGFPVAGITFDLDGDERDPTAPDIGADEYRLPGVAERGPVRVNSTLVLPGSPARTHARVQFELARAVDVRLRLIDVTGRAVAVRDEGHLAAGRHVTTLEFNGLPDGVYVVELRAGGVVTSGKLVKQ